MGSFNLSSVDCSKLPSEIVEILENREKQLAKKRDYYKKNKEKALEYGRTYYMEHVEECRERSRNYYLNHLEECRERSRNYYHKKKLQIEKAISEAKAVLSNSSNEDFNVNVPFGGSNSPMSQERQYEEMKQNGKANCTFESFKVARQMIELGNSIISGEASL
jgi:hypothetical protein